MIAFILQQHGTAGKKYDEHFQRMFKARFGESMTAYRSSHST